MRACFSDIECFLLLVSQVWLQICGKVVAMLDDGLLLDLGVSSRMERTRILARIKELTLRQSLIA